MTRSRIIFVVLAGVSLWSACAAGGQGAPLPPALRTHLQTERLQIVTSVRGLPLGVRDALQTLFGTSNLDIAEPDAEFQAAAATSWTLPSRRLAAAGCSSDHCLVYYERGGATHTWHVALFHWTPEATRFEWGGTAPAGVRAIDDVRSMVLDGQVRGSGTTGSSAAW